MSAYNKHSVLLFALILVGAAVFYYGLSGTMKVIVLPAISEEGKTSAAGNRIEAETPGSVFSESFEGNFVLEEVWPREKSASEDWWVSSGAYLVSKEGVGHTYIGELDDSNRWFKKYQNSNLRDTDGGKRPQNVFRLATQKQFLNLSQEVYARILHYDESDSEFRNESNGVLLFNRYQDEDNLYYSGIRVDGYAVVKKKLDGVYITLGTARVFDGAYDRDTNPNVLPLGMWIGLKSTVYTTEDGDAEITVFVDRGRTGSWEEVLRAVDDGFASGPPITEAGSGGIRTDFMDMQFDDYFLQELNAI